MELTGETGGSPLFPIDHELLCVLCLSCFVCFEFWWRFPPLTLVLIQKMLTFWVGWSLSSEVIGSMLWVCPLLRVGQPLADLVGFAYFLDCLRQVISKQKFWYWSLGAAKLFILLVEIRPNQFSSTKVDFIDRVCHKSQWVQSESKEWWHIFLANSFRVTFQTQKFVCQTIDWCILLSMLVCILKSLDFELDLILAQIWGLTLVLTKFSQFWGLLYLASLSFAFSSDNLVFRILSTRFANCVLTASLTAPSES